MDSETVNRKRPIPLGYESPPRPSGGPKVIDLVSIALVLAALCFLEALDATNSVRESAGLAVALFAVVMTLYSLIAWRNPALLRRWNRTAK